MKQPGETIAAYTAELRKIAEHCSFGDSLDDMLRDHIICGINDITLQRRLLAEPELSYQTAFKMVHVWETADSNSKDLQKPQGSNVTVNRVVRNEQPITTRPNQGGNPSSASNTSCKRCGGQHPASECKHRHTKCHVCQKKGHLARVC